jgi:tetratricopeptide (TPR) repeat protein
MNKKTIAIILMIAGAALVVGVTLFALDRATSAEPDGLGTWIFTVLGLLLGASTGLKGWVDWKKKDAPSKTTTINTGDHSLVASGEHGRNIEQGSNSQYIEHYHAAAEPDVPAFHPLHQLPQPPADFTGREELIAQLLQDFHTHQGAAISGQSMHGLTGMGGIGKTALGLVVAHRLADEYPDAQLFLDLKGTTTPLRAVEIVRHVLLSLQPNLDVRGLSEENMQAAYLSVLHGKRVLLFLDNARSAEQVAPLRPPEKCALLVTSRWSFPLPGLQNRRLDLLSEKDSIELLTGLCPRIGDHAAGLARACACLPLALRIAGSFLQVNDHWDVQKYLTQLKDRSQRLAALHHSHADAGLQTEPDLLAAFELSYNGLSQEQQVRWRRLGVFPATFDALAAGALWGLQEEPTLRLLGLLRRYSLLDYDEASARYSLHDLLADYACSQMEKAEAQEARSKHAAHYKDVLRAADDLYEKGGENVLPGLRLFDLEWENIRTGHDWAAAARGREETLARLCVEYPDAGAYILDLRQHPAENIRWLEAALSSAREMGDRGSEGVALGNLGIAYKNLGETRKAIELQEGHLKIARELGDRRGEGNALGSLGIAYKNLGETRKAIEFYEQWLGIARELGDRRGEGQALGNLGVAYKNLGETHKAIEYYEQVLVIFHEIGDRRGEGDALGNLGTAYTDLGETRKAMEFHEQALVIDREIGDRRGEGQDLGNLGNAYYLLGETRKAIEFYEQALVIDREIGDRGGEGNALGNLGTAYYLLGETRKAIEFHEQALVIARELGDRRGEGNASFNMGLDLYSLDEKERAIELVGRALVIYEAIESPYAENARRALKEWGTLPGNEEGQGA